MTTATRPPLGRALATPMPVAEALARLRAACPPRPPEERPPAAAIGAVLAADLHLAAPLPAADTALLDGWAVEAVETVGASPYAPAFVAARPVAAGAAVPTGCDAVVRRDDARLSAGLLVVETALAPGDGLRRAGFDAAAGAVLARAGTRLSATAALLAEAAGHASLAVRRPRVAVVAAADPAATRLAGWLAATLAATGADPTAAARDADVDLVIRVAGAAVAADDAAVAAMAAAGTLLASALAATTADDVALGLDAARPCLVLPARLDTVFVVTRLLVAPLLAARAAAAPAPTLTRPLARKLVSRVGLTDVALLAAETDGSWRPLATGELSAAALLAAAAWVALPPESEGLADGTAVAAHPLVAIEGVAP